MLLSWFSARERRRRAAARWFVRMRGENAARLKPRFDRWIESPANAEAYRRVAQSFDSAALLRLSRLADASASLRKPDNHGSAALAASLALALLVPAAWVAKDHGPWAHGPAMLMASTNVGEMKTIALADGSSIMLDTDSAISYESGGMPGRAILHRGRARFLSAGSSRPFRVEALGTRVEAGAAEFDMSLIGERVSIASFAGEVEVLAGEEGRSLAGGTAAVAANGGLRPSRPLDPRWPQGMLEFDDEPLSSAVMRANRYSKVQIRIEGAVTGGLRVSGAYRTGDVEGLARALASAFRLQLRPLPGGDIALHEKPRG